MRGLSFPSHTATHRPLLAHIERVADRRVHLYPGCLGQIAHRRITAGRSRRQTLLADGRASLAADRWPAGTTLAGKKWW